MKKYIVFILSSWTICTCKYQQGPVSEGRCAEAGEGDAAGASHGGSTLHPGVGEAGLVSAARHSRKAEAKQFPSFFA